MLHLAVATFQRYAEGLKRLVLRRRRKREVAGVRQHLARRDDPVDPFLDRLLIVALADLRQRRTHGGGRLAALARVGLVDQNGEATLTVLASDVIQNKRELLDRRDDDLLATSNEGLEVSGAVGPAYRCANLCELLDRVTDLLVEDNAVGYNDDRVESARPKAPKAYELVGQPSDRVGLAAAGGVLN